MNISPLRMHIKALEMDTQVTGETSVTCAFTVEYSVEYTVGARTAGVRNSHLFFCILNTIIKFMKEGRCQCFFTDLHAILKQVHCPD